MAICLGVDTGGTYTDAVLLDEDTDEVLAKAKALTSRPDLSLGVGAAIDAVLTASGIAADQVGLVSLSTTLATNALVEGQGGRVALVFIGFDAGELARDGLQEALAGDPVIAVAGGHDHSGTVRQPLDEAALREALSDLPDGITGLAVAGRFATRNAAHEVQARDMIRDMTGLPVTCSHELSQALGGPKRALTAVLNARLIGMIDQLIGACEEHLARRGIDARLMVVRGDGALVPAGLAREKPIETILSGPAASIAGAQWLTGVQDALVSDIGGTTTDICLLRAGKPAIDPQGARVGPYRTMVEAVAMRTHGLGGDSEVHLLAGLDGGLRLGPRRVMPVSLLAMSEPKLVHDALDRALSQERASSEAGRFVVPLWGHVRPGGLDKREASVVDRLAGGPLRLADAVTTRVEAPALDRLVNRGLVRIAAITPSDAAHVAGLVSAWDARAAEKAMTLFSRQKTGAGTRLAPDGVALAPMVIAALHRQTEIALLDAAFAEDGTDWGDRATSDLARHPLTQAGLDGHDGVLRVRLSLGVPVIGLGASAGAYYGAVGERLGTEMIVPDHAEVANAIGAVVGQVSMGADGTVTSPGPGRFVAHLLAGPQIFGEAEQAIAALELDLSRHVISQAWAAGVDAPRLSVDRDIRTAEVEGSTMFVSAAIRVRASGRPRIAVAAE